MSVRYLLCFREPPSLFVRNVICTWAAFTCFFSALVSQLLLLILHQKERRTCGRLIGIKCHWLSHRLADPPDRLLSPHRHRRTFMHKHPLPQIQCGSQAVRNTASPGWFSCNLGVSRVSPICSAFLSDSEPVWWKLLWSQPPLIGADRTTWTGLDQHMEPDSLPTDSSHLEKAGEADCSTFKGFI